MNMIIYFSFVCVGVSRTSPKWSVEFIPILFFVFDIVRASTGVHSWYIVSMPLTGNNNLRIPAKRF